MGIMQTRRPTYYKERTCWHNMKQRCYNVTHDSYKNYGAKGITVCQRWLDSFDNFYADMGTRPEKMTLDRLDSSKPYSPDNCRWATYQEQAHNRGMFVKNKTGFRGVSYHIKRTSRNKYHAQVVHNGVLTGLGWYGTAEEAALAYDSGAIQAYGDLAQLNIL